MQAHAIILKDNENSERGYEGIVSSNKRVGNDLEIHKFEAITPDYVDATMKEHNIKWNYPWRGKEIDFATGLTKTAYKTKYPQRRIACALSHYLLWKRCMSLNMPILVLEHDAVFVKKLDFKPSDTNLWVLGINSPLGATRKAHDYYNQINRNPQKFQFVPKIDDTTIPQGLAGNSAYIIKPTGAKHMVQLVKSYGLWPNDALMCKQLMPRMGVTKTFYTKVNTGMSSTTSS